MKFNKEKNLETDKICKNEKCKWDLTYAKDGAFIGLSENELIDYNTKLQQAKKNYENQILLMALLILLYHNHQIFH